MGVEVKARRNLLKSYPDTFVGSDAVNWLCDRYNISRVAAVDLGQKMLNMGFFENAKDPSRAFEDASQFYRFVNAEAGGGPAVNASTTIYDFTVLDINKNPVKLDRYKDMVLLVVNVASF